ncbi:hypothetical protein F7725_024664 [Dissostichus mawsoni]|uniref:Uncharacterized protein n=1 Tax=Dissostichus mawsoni TaxID=36200 RepID=A0A7J5X8Y3_DISMA|nr:hypothetical protein F7725_024664 [Dissostichus mawsoni]
MLRCGRRERLHHELSVGELNGTVVLRRLWVHVVCALYVPGVAFGDIDKLRPHADRFDRKWKRKNYLALQSYCKVSLQEREKQLTPEAQKHPSSGLVPREKLPRPLTSSASAIRKLMRKAELMGISTDIFPVDTSDANASMDGRRKHKQPALTADFVNYYMERNMRMIQIQDNISEQKSLKDKLESEQRNCTWSTTRWEANLLCESLEELLNVNGDLRSEGQAVWTLLGDIMGQKLNTPAVLKAPKERKPSKKEEEEQQGRPPACQRYSTAPYLQQMQCSECDQASSDEADIAMETLPDGTKRSRRQIKGPIKFIPQEMSPEPKKHQVLQQQFGIERAVLNDKCSIWRAVVPSQKATDGIRTRGQKRKRVAIGDDRDDKTEYSPPVFLSTCLPLHLSLHLSSSPPVFLSTCPLHLSSSPPVFLSTCLPLHLSSSASSPPVFLSTCLPLHLSSPPVFLSTCLPLHLSSSPPVLSTCLPLHLSLHLSSSPPVSPPVFLSTCLPLHLSSSPPVFLYTCLYTCLPLHLSSSPPVFLYTCLYTCLPLHLSSLHLSSSPPVFLSTCLSSTCLPLHLSSSPPVFSPPVFLSTCLPLHLSSSPPVFLSTCLPLHLSSSPPVFLSTCLPLHLSSSPPVFLSV